MTGVVRGMVASERVRGLAAVAALLALAACVAVGGRSAARHTAPPHGVYEPYCLNRLAYPQFIPCSWDNRERRT